MYSAPNVFAKVLQENFLHCHSWLQNHNRSDKKPNWQKTYIMYVGKKVKLRKKIIRTHFGTVKLLKLIRNAFHSRLCRNFDVVQKMYSASNVFAKVCKSNFCAALFGFKSIIDLIKNQAGKKFVRCSKQSKLVQKLLACALQG